MSRLGLPETLFRESDPGGRDFTAFIVHLLGLDRRDVADRAQKKGVRPLTLHGFYPDFGGSPLRFRQCPITQNSIR